MKKEPLTESEYLENIQNVRETIFAALKTQIGILVGQLGTSDDYFKFTAKRISREFKVKKELDESIIIEFININN